MKYKLFEGNEMSWLFTHNGIYQIPSIAQVLTVWAETNNELQQQYHLSTLSFLHV